MKLKVGLYAFVVALALLLVSERSYALVPIDQAADTYAYQSDSGAYFGQATRTLAVQSVSGAAYRVNADQAKKSLLRFVCYFNHSTPYRGFDTPCGDRWCAAEPKAQVVRRAMLCTLRI